MSLLSSPHTLQEPRRVKQPLPSASQPSLDRDEEPIRQEVPSAGSRVFISKSENAASRKSQYPCFLPTPPAYHGRWAEPVLKTTKQRAVGFSSTYSPSSYIRPSTSASSRSGVGIFQSGSGASAADSVKHSLVEGSKVLVARKTQKTNSSSDPFSATATATERKDNRTLWEQLNILPPDERKHWVPRVQVVDSVLGGEDEIETIIQQYLEYRTRKLHGLAKEWVEQAEYKLEEESEEGTENVTSMWRSQDMTGEGNGSEAFGLGTRRPPVPPLRLETLNGRESPTQEVVPLPFGPPAAGSTKSADEKKSDGEADDDDDDEDARHARELEEEIRSSFIQRRVRTRVIVSLPQCSLMC